MKVRLAVVPLLLCLAAWVQAPRAQEHRAQEHRAQNQPVVDRWTAERANTWYAQQPWLVGANFIPSDAINELGWPKSLALKTIRFFWKNRFWSRIAPAFKNGLPRFLATASGTAFGRSW